MLLISVVAAIAYVPSNSAEKVSFLFISPPASVSSCLLMIDILTV